MADGMLEEEEVGTEVHRGLGRLRCRQSIHSFDWIEAAVLC